MAATTPLTPSASELTKWGLNPAWSRRVEIPGADGAAVNWHVLDTGVGPRGTIVCVHGNPTWGYLWRDFLTTLSPDWRVIAVDQTGMGYSERGRPRVLAQRIEELVSFCQQEIEGPLILAAHDWGGPVAVGAAASLSIDALILGNTAVAKPDDVKVPPLIATARKLVDLSCRRTPVFVDGTALMTNRCHRTALRAPYRSAERREAVRDFVADIPVVASDVSQPALDACAAGFANLTCPILLLWGGKDPVFHDRFLRDLVRRAPHAEVQRFENAGHLVLLDEPVGGLVREWLEGDLHGPVRDANDSEFSSVLETVARRADDDTSVYEGPDGRLLWRALAERSRHAAAALREAGLAKGDRVSLLLPPSPDLLVATIGVWRAGGVPVVADASAGIRALRRLVRARSPRFVLGTKSTLLAARALRFAPGATAGLFGSLPRALDLRSSSSAFEDVVLDGDDVAAIVHTSGATGPAKAVRYTHGQLVAQRNATAPMFHLEPGDAFTTSFGAFMLLSPLLEMTCVRPGFDVSAPSELGFDEFASALAKAPVTTAWLSPASARTILATSAGRHLDLNLVMLAGAPISESLVEGMASLTGGEVRTPYGMTECLPATDGIRAATAGSLGGLGVGKPLPGCELRIEPLANVEWGEILVSAPWLFDGYEGALQADLASTVSEAGVRFHRTGDVGYLEGGQLFSLGRRAHVIERAEGPLASVMLEEQLRGTVAGDLAAVGVGPLGRQVVVVVVEAEGKLRLASASIRRAVRKHLATPVAAVLEGPLPTDQRHQSKIDRVLLGRQASAFLAGR